MITGTVVSIRDNKFVTDNPFWPGPFKASGPINLGDVIMYNEQNRNWFVFMKAEACHG